MRKAVLGSIAVVAAGAGWASGQSPRLPASVMPAPVSVAPGGGVMPASMDLGMPPDAQMMVPPGGGMMPPGPFPGDNGMGMSGPPGGYGGAPQVDNSSRLSPKLEMNVKALLYFTKAQPTPGALVTTSAPGAGGLIGQPSTAALFGGQDFGMGLFSGFDISGILWKDPDRRIGFILGGMMLERKSRGLDTSSDATGQPLLARPFTNAQTGNPDSLLIAFPNAISGGVQASVSTQLYGGHGGLAWNIFRSCPSDCCLMTMNWTTEFAHYGLTERINVLQSSTLINGNTAVFDQKVYSAPASFTVRDRIEALNQFYGGSVGLTFDARYGRVYLNMYGKLGMGVMHQRLDIRGDSTVRDPNTNSNSVIRGGLLANNANIGRFNHDEFSLIPEAGATLGYNWTSWFTTTVGYGFMYTNNVIRPGQQISSTVNPSLVPAHPAFGGAAVPVPNPAFTQTDFWAQGVQLGFVFRW